MHAHKNQVFCKLIPSFFMGLAKHAQSTQFTLSLQYLKKEVRNEVHFLHADKHQSFPLVYIIIFGWFGQAFAKYTKYQVSNILEMLFFGMCIDLLSQVDFLHADTNFGKVKVWVWSEIDLASGFWGILFG